MQHLNNLAATGIAGNVATTLTVSARQLKTLLYGQIVLTTDATVANRRVIVSVLDPSGTLILDIHGGAVVTASATDQHHELMQGVYRESAFVGDALQIPIPKDMKIPPEHSLKISVENGQAGDSYDYSLMLEVDHVVPGQTVIS